MHIGCKNFYFSIISHEKHKNSKIKQEALTFPYVFPYIVNLLQKLFLGVMSILV